jgi:hypothetical protein
MSEEEFNRLLAEHVKRNPVNEAEVILKRAREEQEKFNNLPWKKKFDLKLKAQATDSN